MENNDITPSTPTSIEPNATSVKTDIQALNELIQKESAFLDLVTSEMKKVIVGQPHMIESLLIAFNHKGLSYYNLFHF